MRKILLAVFSVLLLPLTAWAQESQEVYSFLRLPVSAHVAALGGDNITIDDDDPTLIFHNPALINQVSDKSLNLNFMTYMEGAKTASASFIKAYKERATWGVAAQYMDYGSIKETTVDNVETGSFSARDIALAGTFAYMLNNSFSGGITARLVSSHIASYSSLAVAVDLGLNYMDEEQGWSLSAVAKNLGGQIKAYDDDFERMPLDLQIGFTKRLLSSPLRISASLVRLNDWEYGFGKHLVIGADIILSPQFYIAAGYNAMRASEMKISENDGASSHGAGLSIGGGLQLQRLKLNVAYAKYHVTTSSILINLSYAL